MSIASRISFGVVVTLLSGWSTACACDPPAAEMRAFVLDEANQACVNDSDCVTASTGCADLGVGQCSQVGLSKDAEQSNKWRDLVEESNDCESECSHCLAALSVACTDGLCFTP